MAKKSIWNRPITRRSFIKGAAIAGGAAMLPSIPPFVKEGHAFARSASLRKFIQPLPIFGVDIPLASPAPLQPYVGVDYYQITAGVYRQRLHPDLPGATRLYGYADHMGNYAHLGGAIVATKDRPVRYSFTSNLPAQHILPYDTSIPSPGNGGSRQDRSAVHLHGGLVPWTSDGGPFHWQSNPNNLGGLQYGASVIPWLWDGALNPDGTPNAASVSWDYFYPNHQSSRLMWYHDHAIGQTRTNAYAGVASGYIVTGPDEAALGLPFGHPIVFQDKVFWDPVSDPTYATYAPGAQPGDLWYPWFYDPAIWPVAKGGVPPIPSAVPEFFGDTMLANGVVFPFHTLPQGMHRFRLLNACNARFLDLSFVLEDPAFPGEPLLNKKNGVPVAANVDVWILGTEGGFLPTPVPLVTAGVPLQPFILGNAERADIVIRFNGPGNVILYNVAGAPFPGGAPIFDWFPGNRALALPPAPGFGPNTRTIMRFQVTPSATPVSFPIPATIPTAPQIPTVPDPVNGGLMVDVARLGAMLPGYTYDPAQLPEELTLNEVVEPATFSVAGNTGRLQTLLGNRKGVALLPFGPLGTYYEQPVTEFVRYKTIRIWKIYNNTVDAHPMHFHLFSVQILGRQKANNNFGATGRVRLPFPSEMGLKETVVAYPGEVLTLAALVEDPLPVELGYTRNAATGRPEVPVTVNTAAGPVTVRSALPVSPRLAAAPYNLTNADEYVWHCHILEHEEHDMMRPLVGGP